MDPLEPEYKVPSHQTIMQRINKMYGEVKGVVEKGMNDVNDVALTTDAWTSLATESYVTVTVHYITKEVLTSCHPPEGPAYVTAYENDKTHKNEETTTVDIFVRSLFLLHSV